MASSVIDKVKLSIGNSFLVKNQGCVPTIKFANVKINACNGNMPTSFSDARISLETGQSVILAMFWHKAIYSIMKNKILNNIKSPVDIVFNKLINYINNVEHKQHLKVLNESLSEADIQSVLAHHFFAPLSATGKYTIDANHQKSLKCYACKEDNNLGDTSFGHIDIWHGHADILIEKSIVKVEANRDDEEDEEEEEAETEREILEPQRKLQRLDSDGSRGSINESIPQVLAQTIVNAYFESSKNQQLADYYIPSFLATPKCVSVHMYNCKRDRLYTSVDLPIWDTSDSELNFSTVITVWLALNFDRLATCVPDDEFSKRHIPTSNFKICVEKSLEIYNKCLSKPLKDAGKKRMVNRNFDVANEFLTLRTEYNDSIAASLHEVQELFEKMTDSNDGS